MKPIPQQSLDFVGLIECTCPLRYMSAGRPTTLKGVTPDYQTKRSRCKVSIYRSASDLVFAIQTDWSRGDKRTLWFWLLNYDAYTAVEVNGDGWLGDCFFDAVYDFWRRNGLPIMQKPTMRKV